jgi:outer membrane protein assembly factor BamA
MAICPWMVLGQTDSEVFTLNDIKMIGLIKIDSSRAVTASGLHFGQKVTLKDINGAAGKLVDSGFFRSANYSYRYAQGKMDLEFQVEETEDLLPCIFDNFVWFRREELIDAIKNKIPLFEENLPRSGSSAQDAADALEEMLRKKRLPGTVAFIMSQKVIGGPATGISFDVRDINLPIQSVLFSGVEAFSETELQEKSRPLLGQNYSSSYVEKFVDRNLGPAFRQKGYLRVGFGQPEAAVQGGSTPENAVTVGVGVTEGPAYNWNEAVWSGDLPFAVQNLNRILGMKTGEIADASKIEKGLNAIRSESGNNGYLEMQYRIVQNFNDAAGRVNYDIRLASGPQYRMGGIAFKGVAKNVSERLRSKWEMARGEIFNQSYFNKFLKTQLIGIRFKKLSTQLKPDRRRAVVDVVIEFQ